MSTGTSNTFYDSALLREIKQEGASRVNMSNLRLTGHIPPEIGLLKNLEVVCLYNNDLVGTIPRELGNLKHLTNLSLFGNSLNGVVPCDLCKLVNLKYLQLHNNQFTSVNELILGISRMILLDSNNWKDTHITLSGNNIELSIEAKGACDMLVSNGCIIGV